MSWSVYQGEDTNWWWAVVDADGNELGSTDGGFEYEEAHMMAASKDLYYALENVIYSNDIEASDKCIAIAALKKAIGEEI